MFNMAWNKYSKWIWYTDFIHPCCHNSNAQGWCIKYQRHLCFINIKSLPVCSKKKLCAIYGKWTECLYTVDPATFDAHKKSDKKNSDEKKGSKQVLDFKFNYVLSQFGSS